MPWIVTVTQKVGLDLARSFCLLFCSSLSLRCAFSLHILLHCLMHILLHILMYTVSLCNPLCMMMLCYPFCCALCRAFCRPKHAPVCSLLYALLYIVCYPFCVVLMSSVLLCFLLSAALYNLHVLCMWYCTYCEIMLCNLCAICATHFLLYILSATYFAAHSVPHFVVKLGGTFCCSLC